MIILDTNVLSEPARPRPSEAVIGWLNAQARADVFTTAVTEAEILLRVELMPAGRRRNTLTEQVRRTFDEDFHGRVLPFDSVAARAYATLVASRQKAGKPLQDADAQIAAIALSRGASVATRNVGHFSGCGLDIINPWTA
ncbi:MAG: type II toxin-antitoxin system VapC family toxin [Alphaproteobacteria bacterium]|nr:type II toxin-antitoxin system VapC family toxin [Alphaproteobacteria bacterium]